MSNIREIEEYINRYTDARKENFLRFYEDANKHRATRTGIYKLIKGSELMDLLETIRIAFEEALTGNLIPEKHTRPKDLFDYLIRIKDSIIDLKPAMKLNYEHVKEINIHSYETHYIDKYTNDFLDMINYILDIYDIDQNTIPLQRMRRSLISVDIEEFFEILNNQLAHISYLIKKDKEGYLHSNIILLLKILDFEIVGEESTNIGRINATIKFSSIIYIMEFKRSGTPEEAIKQIIENKYYEKYFNTKTKVYLVGAVFDNKNRRIEKFKTEEFKV